MNDGRRTALIVFIQSLFPLAVLAGVDITGATQAAITLAISNGLTLFMLFWRSGQQDAATAPKL